MTQQSPKPLALHGVRLNAADVARLTAHMKPVFPPAHTVETVKRQHRKKRGIA